MSSFGLPAGAFDDVADDAIWGAASPSDAPKFEQRHIPGTSRAFRDVYVDMDHDYHDDVVDDDDVDVDLTRKLSSRPTSTERKITNQSTTSCDSKRKELFLLGSTFKSDTVTVDYVAVNLTHTFGMNPRVANKLAKKLRRNQGSIAISLGVMSDEKCKEIEKALKIRDIDCQSMPVAPSANTSSNSIERPTTIASVAGSVPSPPANDCPESRSHKSQTPTPRIGNARKALGFGGEQYQQRHSLAALMSSRTASSRKPNHVAAGAHKNASNVDFGDTTARSRTTGAGPPTAPGPPTKSSGTSVASQQQQSLIFSSGNYVGEKRFGKPQGKGTFTMAGQFSYTGDWARGNPVGSGYFKLPNGEIREGSWTGTNFIETRRYFTTKHNAPRMTCTSGQSIATEPSKRKAIGQANVVVEARSSKSVTPSPEEPWLLPESRAERSNQVIRRKESSASDAGNGDYPAECGPYMMSLRAIIKPGAFKSGSLSIQGETTVAMMSYDDVGTYEGEWKGGNMDGVPHGMGSFDFSDGTRYYGNFSEGAPTDGRFTFKDGNVCSRCDHNGNFAEGDGKIALPSGKTFAPSNDIVHIAAKKDDVSVVSVAKSVDSKISARSIESGEAGKYKGQIVAGVPHGLGSMKFADGSKYTGQWRNGSPAKEGTFYFPNGERHYGRWNGSKFEPIKKQKGLHVDACTSIWNDEDGTGSPLPTVEEEEDSGERSCSASAISGASSRAESSPRSNNNSPRRPKTQDVELNDDSSRHNRAGGVTRLDSDSVGIMSDIENIIASMEMSVFSDMEDASVYSQLSGKSPPAKKSANNNNKKKSNFTLTRPNKYNDFDAKSQFDEKSASQGSVSQGESSRSSLPIDIDDASFYSTDDEDVAKEKSRLSSPSSGTGKPKQLRPSKSACHYYNGFNGKCRPYLSSLRCIRLFSTKKSGSFQMESGQSIAGVTYSGIGEYDGEWRGSMLKGVPHGHGQFSWGDGTRYVGDWDQGIPVGQDGQFVFVDGTICNRGRGVVLVQSLTRGFLVRQSLAKQEEEEAATTIQKAWKIYDAPHREQRIAAAIKIQNVLRPYTTAKALAATRIQTTIRSSTAQAAFHEKRSSAILIQTYARRYAARASFLDLGSACIILQARLRGNLLRKDMKDRYIDVDALIDDEDIVQNEEGDCPQEESEEETKEQEPSKLSLAAQVYPTKCAAYFSSLDLSSVNRKGSLYWNENGKHASLTYTSQRIRYNGGWKGSLLDGKPHGKGKMKFLDRTKFYGSFVDGIPTDRGCFKLKNGAVLYSRRIGTIRQEILNELLKIGDRLETDFIINKIYHEVSDIAMRLQLEAEDQAVARSHLKLACILEEDFVLAEQKKISAIEESIKQIEAELAAKRAAEVAALAAFRRSVELQEAITKKRAATKVQALARGIAGRRLAKLEIERNEMVLDMFKAALRREEENAMPQDSIIAAINQVEAREETSSSLSDLSPEVMALKFLREPAVTANPNTCEKIAYLHRKGLSFQKIDKVIKEVHNGTRKAAAAQKAAKLEAEIIDASADDNGSDHPSRNTISTSASSTASAEAPIIQNKKRSFRPRSVAKKVRSAMAGRNKGHENWTASNIHAMLTSNNQEEGESAPERFAALQEALESVISERRE